MLRRLGPPALLVAAATLFAIPLVQAQSVETGWQSPARITRAIEESDRVVLLGNTRHPADQSDLGKVTSNLPMQHMLLQLRRSSAQEKAVEKFIEDLQDSNSPDFHKWLNAHEFGDRFGVSRQDLETVTRWLRAQGFHINVVYPSGMVIDFSGTADQVTRTFGTEIHYLAPAQSSADARTRTHIANVNDPQIPAALAPVVLGVVSLNDYWPHSMHVMRSTHPKFTFNGLFGNTYAMVPGDLATIYNLNPLFSAGYSGQGQTIALIEDTDVFSATDWNTFRAAFGLSKYTSGSFRTVHPVSPTGPNNCTKPGVIAPNDAEAILDVEWASAAAPSAAVEIASCADTTTTFGGLIAVQNLVNSSHPPSIMSISYGQCETENGAAANAAYNSVYQQAAAEGVSIFVAAGDSGASGCDNSVSEATHGVGANAFASTPYNVAVGGTDFSDTYSGTNSIYWNSANSSTFASAISYIPEIPWNNSCAGVLLSNYLGFGPTYAANSLCNDPSYGPSLQTTVAGGGAPSACATGTPSVPGVVSGTCQGWAKPSWQTLVGNPHDGVRDTPDVALFAADGLWSHYYVFCWSDTANGGAQCSGNPSGWSGAGGTSFASPIMAGIQALVNQKTNARQGNPNPIYYALANSEYGGSGSSSCNSSNGNGVASSCIFYDVTLGDMDVNCTGSYSCYDPSAAQGVLSTNDNSYSPAYGTMTGWDFATGIGSVNAANLVANWPTNGLAPGFFLSSSPSSVTMTRSGSGTSTITIDALNGFSSLVGFSASGMPSGVTAAFNPTSSASASTVTFTASSTAAIGTTNVTITGTSGSLSSTTTIALTVNSAGSFTLSASPSSVSVSDGGSTTTTITVNPQNGFNASVALSATGLPSGVTASFNPSSTSGSSVLTLNASTTASVGNFTITVNGTSGTLTGNGSFTLSTFPVPNLNIPAGWFDLDVGSVPTPGSASYSSGVFTITASGPAIYNAADSMHFMYQQLSGDGTIIARVLSASGTQYPEAGVMIRETLNANSAHAFTAYEPFPSAAAFFYWRPTAGADTSSVTTGIGSLPYWVKVVRSGSSFSSFVSPDGVNWTQLGSTQTISMAQNVFIGLAVSANSSSSGVATATFDNVSISTPSVPAPSITSISPTSGQAGAQVTVSGTGFGPQGGSVVLLNDKATAINSWSPTSISVTIPASASSGALVVCVAPSMNCSNPVTFTVISPLPSGWFHQDVGQVNTPGTASYSSGVFTLSASGQYIFGTADGMHFAYQPLSGDGTIVARVVSASGSQYPEAGVMIRETLNAGSTNAFMTYEPFPSPSTYFYWRPSTGAETTDFTSAIPALPYWVKLVRSGSSFSGFMSPDGVNWTQVGSTQTITMAQNVYIGLAVSANNPSAVAIASFDNVSITAPPSFTLSALPANVSVTQGLSASTAITVNSQNGFNGSVTLSASGLPSGVNASFGAFSGNTSTLTFTAGANATTGTSTVTISGTSGSLTTTTSVSLTVAPAPTFTLSASPSSVTVVQGATASTSINVGAQNGFNGTVGLTASGFPSGVNASFSPVSNGTSTMTFTAAANAPVTTSAVSVTVTGTSGSLTVTTSVMLTVAPAPSFTLSASPSSVSVVQGTTSPTTISITALNGFNGTVGFAASGLPSGVSASFSSVSNGTSTMTFTAAANAPVTSAPVTVTVTGTSGSLTATTSVMVSVTAAPTFSLSASPNSVAVMQGAVGSSTITLSAQNGFTQTVGLSVSSVLPGGVTASFSSPSVSSTSTTSTLSFTASGTASLGTFTVTVTGTSGSLTQTTSIMLTIAPVPSYSLSASPNSLSIMQGGTGTSTITVTALNGFNGSVGLSASNVASGVTASFNPTSSANTSELTLTVGSTAALGTSTITITGTSGSVSSTTSVSLTVTALGLPSGWSDLDVGSVATPGSAGYSSGVFTITASGQYIWSTADGMHFAYQPLNGDGTIVARVVSASGSQYPEVGVMIRETLNANSTHAFMAYEPYPSASTYFYWRPTTGASTSDFTTTITALPYWVKVVRSGSSFSGFMSPDGINWTQVGSTQTISMAQNVYIGLAVSANNPGAVATATFDNVSVSTPSALAPSITSVSPTGGIAGAQVTVTGSDFGPQGSSMVLLNDVVTGINSWTATSISITVPSGATSGPLVVCVAPSMNCSNPVNFVVNPLPNGWLDQDVGQVNTPGSASYLNGVFTLSASGATIFGNADGMHFAYQSLSGDGTIIARVVSASGSQYPEAGVMIRETLNANSTHAFMAYEPYPSASTYFYWRPSTGASTSSAAATITALPYWVKVVRSGNSFSGFISPDGVTWTQVGTTQTITMAQSVYVGLALSANNASSVATATFDNVSVTP